MQIVEVCGRVRACVTHLVCGRVSGLVLWLYHSVLQVIYQLLCQLVIHVRYVRNGL